ncbi:hypothetical protein PMIT1303_01719 [Prochlorococcus sp. MIT 1303]|nr:hypothetical protein PMIT1303_01719 [Prochlorococcus sp. MIT 1303]
MTEIITAVADLGDGVFVGGINSNELKQLLIFNHDYIDKPDQPS